MPREQWCCNCCQQCCLPKAERAANSTSILIMSGMGLTSSCNVMRNNFEMPKNIVQRKHSSPLRIVHSSSFKTSSVRIYQKYVPESYFCLQVRGALSGSTAVDLIYHYSHGSELPSRYYTFKQSGTDFKVLYHSCSDLHSSMPLKIFLSCFFGCST